MNLAFKLSNDKPLRDDNPLQLCRIVSLWDVLKVKANDFVEICNILGWMRGYIAVLIAEHPDRTSIAKIPRLNEEAKRLHSVSTRMGLKIVADRSVELLSFLDNNALWKIDQLDRLIGVLTSKLVPELKGELLLRVRPDYKPLYEGKKAFLDDDIIKALPEIKNEAKNARKCFALERYTASAFHLMRIMELIVQRFAADLGKIFDPEEDTWGTILNNQIRPEIDGWNRQHPNRTMTNPGPS